MHSATKFIAGHSDLMGGVLAVKGEKYVSPFKCFLDIISLFTFSYSFVKKFKIGKGVIFPPKLRRFWISSFRLLALPTRNQDNGFTHREATGIDFYLSNYV